MTVHRLLLPAILVCIGPSQGAAEEFNADPGNYRAVIDTLGPGDTVHLAAGNYTDGILIRGMHGTAGAPITITGPETGTPAVFLANSVSNTVQFDDASHIAIRHLTLDGQGLGPPFGVDSRNATHHITLEHLKIIGYSGDQSTLGISTKGPAWNWVIRHNTIIGAGTGMYLGSSTGDFPFVAGLIEYNLIVDTIGYNIQIKQQNPRPTGIGMPTGVNKTIIRHNVFSKRNNASSGINSRPNLLVGHFPRSGDGTDDVYEIYGNFIYQNPSEALFQGEGNVAFYNNLLVNDFGSAVNIQPHNDVPRMIRVFNNTIVASGSGIRVSGGHSSYVQLVIGNAVFAGNPISAANQTDNLTDSYTLAGNYLNNPAGLPGEIDLFPQAGQLAGASIDASSFNTFRDWNLDFNGDQHDGTYRGAYAAGGTNDGWQLDLTKKPEPSGSDSGGGGGDPPPPPPDPPPPDPPPPDPPPPSPPPGDDDGTPAAEESGSGSVSALLLAVLFALWWAAKLVDRRT